MCIRDRINGIIEGLEDRISGLIDEIDSHKKEMTRLSKAITLVTVKGLIAQYENEYVTEEAKVTEIEAKINNIRDEISNYKANITKINSITYNSQLINLTDQEKASVYQKVLSKVVYYSIDYFRGFIVISYKKMCIRDSHHSLTSRFKVALRIHTQSNYQTCRQQMNHFFKCSQRLFRSEPKHIRK